MENVIKSYKGWTLKNFRNFYNENFKGKTRSEVAIMDGGFYGTVQRKGYLDKVFPPKQTGLHKKLEFLLNNNSK